MPRRLSNWLNAYMKYVDETESPTAFNLWSGISAISSSLKKRVFLRRGLYDIFPNQYIVLVGPPGVGKGTAINPAVQLVKDAGTANYLKDRITAEQILSRLAQGFSHVSATSLQSGVQTINVTVNDSTATIVQTELPILLQGSEWMLPLLCELWDKGEFSYETKTKGSFEAKGLCVSLIAGCVPNFISKLNRDATAAVTGGFTSRCIFVYESERSKSIPWPKINGSSQLLDDLIEDLRYIQGISGEFKFSKKGYELWESFYRDDKFKPDQFESEMLAGFKARMASHVLKVSMALSVSRSDALVLEREDLFNAMSIVCKVRDKVDITFRSVGESSLAVAQDRVMRFIESKGLVSRQEILASNYRHVTDEDLTRILYVLVRAGFVREDTSGGKPMYECVKRKGTSKP